MGGTDVEDEAVRVLKLAEESVQGNAFEAANIYVSIAREYRALA